MVTQRRLRRIAGLLNTTPRTIDQKQSERITSNLHDSIIRGWISAPNPTESKKSGEDT